MPTVLACLVAFWTGTSTFTVVVALGLYLVRLFAIAGFYHRYFSHRFGRRRFDIPDDSRNNWLLERLGVVRELVRPAPTGADDAGRRGRPRLRFP